jgi:hypothetical protein
LKNIEEHIEIHDIKAETVASLMIDRDTDIEIAEKGSFYRNICEDIIEMEYLRTSVVSISLSRDGIYQLLPEALFFHEDRLLATRETNYVEELKRLKNEKEVLSTFFKPFDTAYFECSAFLEEVANEMAMRQNNILLNLLFDYNIQKEENKHIKQLAPLLPYAFEIRGDLKFLQQILQAIFKEKVEISLIYRQEYPYREDSIDSPVQVFTFHVKGLNAILYKQMMDELAAFFPFFAEYFLPFDVDYIFKVRDINQVFLLEKPLVLDYNTQLS